MKQITRGLIILLALSSSLFAELYYSHSEYRELYNEKYALEIELKHLNEKFINERLELNNLIADRNARIEQLEKNLRDLQNEKNKNDQRNADTIADRERKLAETSEELRLLRLQKAEDERLCKSRLEDYESKLKALQEKSGNQVKELEKNHREAEEKLLKEIETLKAELEKTRNDNKAKCDEMSARQAKLESALREEIVSLKKELADCQAAKQKQQEELRRLKTLNKEYQDKLDELTKQANSLEDKLAEEIKQGGIRLKRMQNKLIINMDNKILFASGSAELRSGEIRTTLDKISAILAEYPDNDIQVIGHTDDIPIHTDEFRNNWQLSTERALAVLEQLLRNNVNDPSRFNAVGAGQYQPLVPNTSRQNRAQNRRVDIVVVPKVKVPGE